MKISKILFLLAGSNYRMSKHFKSLKRPLEVKKESIIQEDLDENSPTLRLGPKKDFDKI